MANPEHVTIVKCQDAGQIAIWRAKNPAVVFDLSGEDLRGADYTGKDLSGALMRKAILLDCDFSGANLTGADLHLAQATNAVFDNANLSDVNLSGATLDGAKLRGADLANCDLTAASARGATLNTAVLSRAKLCNADVKGANFSDIQAMYADFTGAEMHQAQFTQAAMNHCNLTGVHAHEVAFTQAIMSGVRLDNGDYFNSTFQHARLMCASARGANLDKCTLSNVDAKPTDFTGATFRNANLTQACLDNCVFRGAQFDRASLVQATMRNADIFGANFYETELQATDLTEVVNAPHAHNLTKVRFTGERYERYFDSCVREKWERNWDWEALRRWGNMKLFAVSYTFFLYILTLLLVVALFNRYVAVAREWAERHNNGPTASAADYILSRAETYTIGGDTVVLIVATLLVISASIVYGRYCPEEVKDFTSAQWQYQLNRSLLHYWALSWRARPARQFCAVAYCVGGSLIVVIVGSKLLRVLSTIWPYLDWWPFS